MVEAAAFGGGVGSGIRTVCFFGWTFAASAGVGGTAPGLGVFSDIKRYLCETRVGSDGCQTTTHGIDITGLYVLLHDRLAGWNRRRTLAKDLPGSMTSRGSVVLPARRGHLGLLHAPRDPDDHHLGRHGHPGNHLRLHLHLRPEGVPREDEPR